MSQVNMESNKDNDLVYFCDTKRHLTCKPFSRENLHRMAENLGLARAWFHTKPVDHYDIPVKRIEEITKRCTLVSMRRIYEISSGL